MRPLLHQRAQLFGIAAAVRAVLETLFARPLRIAHQLDQAKPLVLLTAAKVNETVAGAHNVPGRDHLVRGAGVVRAAVRVVDVTELEKCRETLLDGDVDRLSLSRPQAMPVRRQSSERAVGSGLELRLMAEQFERRPYRGRLPVRGQRRRTAGMEGLQFVATIMAARAAVSENRDLGDNQLRMARADLGRHQGLGALVHRRHVVNQNVGLTQQASPAARARRRSSGRASRRACWY